MYVVSSFNNPLRKAPNKLPEDRLRTFFMTYEAEDEDAADTFMVVMGTVAENIRGIKIVEYQDDTVFTDDGVSAMETLHAITTAKNNLTPSQLREIEEFSRRLTEWQGEQD